MAMARNTSGARKSTARRKTPPEDSDVTAPTTRRSGFRRLPVELNPALLDYLRHVSDLTQVSRAEAVRRAILLYGWAVDQAIQGRSVVAIDDGDEEVKESYGGEPGLRIAAMEHAKNNGKGVGMSR